MQIARAIVFNHRSSSPGERHTDIDKVYIPYLPRLQATIETTSPQTPPLVRQRSTNHATPQSRAICSGGGPSFLFSVPAAVVVAACPASRVLHAIRMDSRCRWRFCGCRGCGNIAEVAPRGTRLLGFGACASGLGAGGSWTVLCLVAAVGRGVRLLPKVLVVGLVRRCACS
jgi:hypothetical protein